MEENKKLGFVTFYPPFIPECFTKDVGMIPTILQDKFNYESKMVCYDVIQEKITDQNIFHLPMEYIKSSKWSEYQYIIKNSKNIDVLNIYHMSIHSLLLLNAYKLLNKKGIAYLKLDLDVKGMNEHERLESWKKDLIRVLQKRIDVISAETTFIKQAYSDNFGCQVYYIPDGYYEYHPQSSQKKENIFLTVGRLGTEQKATEVLLEAFAITANSHDWMLRLVGTVETPFEGYIEQYYKKYPYLRDRVIFTGSIEDKMQLETEYERAKVFLLPSRWESFGLVLVEAIAKGCYIVTTDAVPTAEDVTKKFCYGSCCKVNDVKDLAEHMLLAIEKMEKSEMAQEIGDFSKKFSWYNILSSLDKIFREKK